MLSLVPKGATCDHPNAACPNKLRGKCGVPNCGHLECPDCGLYYDRSEFAWTSDGHDGRARH